MHVKAANTTAVERQQEQAFVRKHGPLNLRRNLLKKVRCGKPQRKEEFEQVVESLGPSMCCA